MTTNRYVEPITKNHSHMSMVEPRRNNNCLFLFCIHTPIAPANDAMIAALNHGLSAYRIALKKPTKRSPKPPTWMRPKRYVHASTCWPSNAEIWKSKCPVALYKKRLYSHVGDETITATTIPHQNCFKRYAGYRSTMRYRSAIGPMMT